MLLAMILACAAALSSAVPAPATDSVADAPISMVPLAKSSGTSLAIPEPSYSPPDTTVRLRDGIVSAPMPKEPTPGLASRVLYSTALLTGGVLLTYAGVAYWLHRTDADAVVERAGANPLGLMVVASVSIPVGAAMAVLGGTSLIEHLGSLGRSDNSPDRE